MPLIGSDKARQHAYVFAHRTVRDIAHRDPSRFDDLAAHEKLAEALTAVWVAIGQQVPADQHVPGRDVRTSRHVMDGRSIVVVRPPRAEHKSEAHFIAAVIANGELERYFVLEHSWNLDDSPSTYLGEWTSEGHRGFGTGSEPDDEAGFVEAVAARLLPD